MGRPRKACRNKNEEGNSRRSRRRRQRSYNIKDLDVFRQPSDIVEAVEAACYSFVVRADRIPKPCKNLAQVAAGRSVSKMVRSGVRGVAAATFRKGLFPEQQNEVAKTVVYQGF